MFVSALQVDEKHEQLSINKRDTLYNFFIELGILLHPYTPGSEGQ